ncbi:acyl--CoA ligase [Porticoccaceae bacterium]|nr:acyl--CoA ligase [Porticoccaceae bacterium]
MLTSSAEQIATHQRSGLWEGVVLHQLLDDCVAQVPKQMALADQPNRAQLVGSQPHRLTFEQLQWASQNLATLLLERGVGVDDRVIVQLPNIVELVVCYLAISQIGAIISPVPIQYGQHELTDLVASLEATAFISIDQFKDEDFGQSQAVSLSENLLVLLFGDSLALNLQPPQPIHLKRLDEISEQVSDANRIITICWTSGTTGLPKGVPRSHNMWVTVARNCVEAGDYQIGDKLLNAFPLVNMASVGTFLYGWLMVRGSLVLHHPFEPAVFLKQIAEESVNFTIIPPPMLNQLAKNEALWNQFDFSALRSIGSGSAPLAPWMMEKFENEYGKTIINLYGSNEGINLFSKPCDVANPAERAVMFPRFGVEGLQWPSAASHTILTKLIDTQSGAEINQSGIAGELAVKGPTVFDGYWGTKNEQVFTDDGYFLTGDLVEICGEMQQFYRIVGRCKDIINRGGMKISPEEIDVLLEGFSGAVEAAVCAYPDETFGERVCACIVAEDTANPPALDEICNYLLAKGIAKNKLPERIEIMQSLPRNPLGKVQRFVLQKRVSA